jgi:hypothetical protein
LVAMKDAPHTTTANRAFRYGTVLRCIVAIGNRGGTYAVL